MNLTNDQLLKLLDVKAKALLLSAIKEQKAIFKGDKGEGGALPSHRWEGSSLQIELSDGTWGELINLKGDKGDKGEKGEKGNDGKSISESEKELAIEMIRLSLEEEITDIYERISELESKDGIDALIENRLSELTNILSPEGVRGLLMELEGEERLDAKYIKNLPEAISNTIVGGSKHLNQLSDVSVVGLTSGDILQWNGSMWVSTAFDDNGILSLNGLTGATQTFTVTTIGTDFNIVSSGTSHSFNLPTASGSTRGALTKGDWSTFNGKQDAISLTTTGTSGAATFIANVLNIPNYGSALTGYVPYTGATGSVTIGAFSLTATGITVTGLTASRAVVTDASDNLASSATTSTEIGFVSGVTSAIQTQLNAKEPTITVGTTAQYWRGDKTFQTLNTSVVPESTNLYFTNARAIASTLTAYASGAGTITAADSILTAIQKLNGNIGAIVSGVSSVNSLTGAVSLVGTANQIVVSSGTWSLASTITGLTSVTSTTFVGALTGNASTATTLATGRTIAITGDLAYTSPSFDGSANVTAAGTLATVNATVGTFGSATQVAQVTVNAKGLTTAVANVTITPAAGSITGGAALTKVDDTNVTLTLGGTPTTALLAATSLTLGWTGTLANARLTNSSITIGSTAISLGGTSTTLAGLTSVTSTSFVGALTGNADTVTVANEAVDTTCFIGFYTAASGSLGGKTSTGMTYDSSTRIATFSQPIAASVTGNSATVTTNANLTGHIISTGNATTLNTTGAFSSAQLSTALSDKTGTGVAVFGTSPTFTTQIISPIVYGSSSASGTLTIAGTSNATKGFTYIGSTTTVAIDETNKFFGLGTATPGGQLHMAGNISAAAWGASGIKIRQPAATITDTTSSGTVAANYMNTFGAHLLAATNVTTYSSVITAFFQSAVESTNVTITNNWAAYFQGNAQFTGDIGFGSTFPAARIHATGSASRSTSWGLNGAGIRWASATYTDTVSTGTVTSMAVHGFAAMAIAATNVTTYTNAYGFYMVAPTEGSNVTFTNIYAGYFVGRLAATTNLQVGTGATDARFTIAGNTTLAAWGTAGAVMRTVAGTYTDSSTAIGGTVASAAMHSFGIHPIAATNATVTVTNAHTVYVAGVPSNGANVTVTNAWSIYVNAGRSRFAGINFAAQSATALTAPIILTTGTLNTTAEIGAIEYSTPALYFTNSGGVRQEIPLVQQSRVATDISVTSNVTLANITGLTETLAAGKHYRFEAVIFVTCNVAGGVQFAIAGTATATNIIYDSVMTSGGAINTPGTSRGTALATKVGDITAVTVPTIVIKGFITCANAGTLTVQFAQNVSSVSASVVKRGSTFEITELT